MRKSTNVTLTVVTAMGLTAQAQQLPQPGNSNPVDCRATAQRNGAGAQDCVHGSTRSGIFHFRKRGGFGAIGASSKGGG